MRRFGTPAFFASAFAGVLALAIGGVSYAIDEAPPAAAPAAAPASGAFDRALGEKLYAERCAACHDNPTGRTPAKATLQSGDPAAIIEVLRSGVMAPMAAGLSPREIGSIAFYLTGKTPPPPPGVRGEGGGRRGGGGGNPFAMTSAQTPLDGPLCKGKPKPMTLDGPQWNGWGANGSNWRYQPDPGFTPAEVPRLKVKWAFHYPGWKQGQATLVGGRLFVTSMNGAVYSLDPKTGCVHWRHDAAGPTRTSVSIGALPKGAAPHRFALYYTDWTQHANALDAETGKLIWRTKVDDQAGVQMTGSPLLWEGKLFVPVSSGIEAFAQRDSWECCKFRGKLIALDGASGKILWHRFTTDQEPTSYTNAEGRKLWGPSGGAIWSTPTIDPKRRTLYVATSNSYTDVPHDGSDAVLAIDVDTGAVKWRKQVTGGDDYMMGCYPQSNPRAANCPQSVGGDYALGSSPILAQGADGKDVVLAGQKSSEVYAMDPEDGGRILWQHRLSVGSELGGVEFGSASDGETLYVPISDVIAREWGRPGLTAIRIRDGYILWTAPAPRNACRWKNVYCSPAMSAAVTATPGLVFGGSMDGRFRAYEAATGKVIWETDTGIEHTTVLGKTMPGGIIDGPGPTIANGMVFINSGYAGRQGSDGTVLLAFSVDGK